MHPDERPCTHAQPVQSRATYQNAHEVACLGRELGLVLQVVNVCRVQSEISGGETGGDTLQYESWDVQA
jgi:hypothetical protein